MLKILIDFRKYDGLVGGVERFVIETTKHIVEKGHKIVLLPRADRLIQVAKEFDSMNGIKYVPVKVVSHSISLKNMYTDAVTIQEIAKAQAVDIIHFPYNWSFPLRKAAPCVITIHDLIPFSFPEAMGVFSRILYGPAVRTASRLNDEIVTVSKFSKKDIVEKIGVSPSKVKIIPNGLRKQYKPSEKYIGKVIKKYQLQDGFIVNVGGIHERKNNIRLIKSFSKFIEKVGFPGKLVITGSVSGTSYKLRMKRLCDTEAQAAGIGDKIVFTGYVSDRELEVLLRKAAILVYPSLYEGFGLPILEAMNVGTPVITSNITSLPEVAGSAALLVDPYSLNEIVSAMSRLYENKNLQRRLIKKGKERAKKYSWRRTAELYLSLYESLLK